LTDEYLRLAYHSIRAKDKNFNVELVSDFDSNIPVVNIVPQDIGRVFLNIITNAFHAMNEKKKAGATNHYEPVLSVHTKLMDNEVEISIADNGNGIPKDFERKIFQPFFTTKPTGQGTGLGLSISYDIIKAHGGNIEFNSEEGKGTTFLITLPIK